MSDAGPLSGITVIEVGRFISAPYATMLLADLGATVVKVESADGGDPFRHVSDDHMPPRFLAFNRSKQSIGIDLRSDGGSRVARDLIRTADVLVENFRPGVMESFGLGYDDTHKLNPRLVYCSITGAGPVGPLAGFPMYDAIGQALSGLGSQLAEDGDPQPKGPAMSDSITGMTAAMAIQAALVQRFRTNQGTHVQTSLLQATVSFLAEPAAHYFHTGEEQDWLTRARQSQSFGFVGSDELPLIIHMSSLEKFWERLLEVVDRQDLTTDSRFDSYQGRVTNYLELQRELQVRFGERPRHEWLRALSIAEVPVAPLLSTRETFAHPQVIELGLAQELEGEGSYTVAGPGVTLSDWKPQLSAPPQYAADTTRILEDLGYSEVDIEALRAEGAVR